MEIRQILKVLRCGGRKGLRMELSYAKTGFRACSQSVTHNLDLDLDLDQLQVRQRLQMSLQGRNQMDVTHNGSDIRLCILSISPRSIRAQIGRDVLPAFWLCLSIRHAPRQTQFSLPAGKHERANRRIKPCLNLAWFCRCYYYTRVPGHQTSIEMTL